MRTCPACNGPESALKYDVRGHRILECAACGCFFLESAASIAEEYQTGYLARSSAGGGGLTGYYDYLADTDIRRRNFRRHLAIISSRAKGRRLLEIGCSAGHFLAVARERFEVTGIDISEESIAHVREELGVEAHCGDVLDVELDGQYDVVAAWETIEHIESPDAVLRKIATWLAPDGLLFIGTGDNRSFFSRLLGKRWWYINPPHHVVIYNRDALRAVLERNGFELVGWERISVARASLRNIGMKVLRSFDVAPATVFKVLRWVPPLRLPVYHGITMVAMARRAQVA